MASITTTQFSAQRVTVETTLPVTEVFARLDKNLSRENASKLPEAISSAKSKEELMSNIGALLAGNDFLFFNVESHSTWMDIYFNQTTPPTTVYTFGNPLGAQAILQHDIHVGLNVPLRILVSAKADGSGTTLLYHLPSSMILTEGSSPKLQPGANGMDAKLAKLIATVSAPS